MSYVVYRCYDAEGRLLYIGCTQDLHARMQVHACDIDNPASRELMPRLATVEYEEFLDRATALAAERAVIAAEHPLLNTHHNPGGRTRNLPPILRETLTPEQRERFKAILETFGGAA